MKTKLTIALLIPVFALAAQNRYGGGGPGNSMGGRGGPGGQNCPRQAECPLNLVSMTSPTTLPAAEVVYAFEEERVAHDLYTAAAEKWGSRVFVNIASAELRHAAALTQLASASAIALPPVQRGVYSTSDLQQLYTQLLAIASESETGALKAGALVEETDITDLRRMTAVATDAGTRAVLSHLEKASMQHLLAFVRNLEVRGITYQPQVMTAEEFNAIRQR